MFSNQVLLGEVAGEENGSAGVQGGSLSGALVPLGAWFSQLGASDVLGAGPSRAKPSCGFEGGGMLTAVGSTWS